MRRIGKGADRLDGQHGAYYLNYNNLTNTPTIPTNNNQLTNGAGYVTSSSIPTNNNQLTNGANYITTSYIGQTSNSDIGFGSVRYYQPSGTSGATANAYVGTDPRWNESGYNANLGTLHIYAQTAAGGNWGQTGLALYSGSAYQYIHTQASQSGLYINNSKVWTAGNDGSGSGLDADTLDGLDLHTGRNDNANKVVRTDGNGYLQTGWINTTSGDSGIGSDISRIYCSNDAYVRYLGKAHFKVLIGLSGKTTYDRRDYTSDSNYWTGMISHGNENMDTTFLKGCGFTDNWSNPANQPSGTSHWNGIQSVHYSAGAINKTYGWQMVVGAGNPSLCYLRGRWGSTGYSWYKMWNAYNDGSGSGLDADTCDGQHLGTSAYPTFNYIHLNGTLNQVTGAGSWIGRNYTYDTCELLGYGAEFMIGAQSTSIHINYRYANGHPNYTPATWYWRNGSSSSWSNHNFGSVTSNGNVYATGNVTAYSDIRLKENIRPIQNALDVVSKLEGVHYTRKETGEEEIGFIAQDVKEVFPELVEIIDSRIDDPHEGLINGLEDLHVMKYQNAVALLVEAIKELNKKIDK